jgi:8-oxo-(d)GTP phosphatase
MKLSPTDVLCGGGFVVRLIDGVEHVGLVERSYYGDVSLPKGHVESGEPISVAAAREVAEELGCTVTIGPFAATMTYPLPSGQQKYVLLWEMRWEADVDHGPDGDEITGRRWVPLADLASVLHYESDRGALRAWLAVRDA